ncbi:MAG: hypothetical protein E7600_05490 [Ruminococcaceae bacterium]|nr:hypothetical protein [Oscillospiraceae bacterium]
MNKILKYVVPALFLAMILFVSVSYIIVEDNKTFPKENRAAQQFPEVSKESVFSGEFTSGMIKYMNDQFPFRNTFMKIGNKFNDVMHLDVSTGDGIKIEKPAVNAGGGAGERLAPSDIEFKSKEVIENNPGGTTLVIDKGMAMEYYSFEPSYLSAYAKSLNRYADELPDVNVYSMLVPTSAEFYLPEKFRNDDCSQKKAIDAVYAETNSKVKRVDVYSGLQKQTANKDNYIYFRTDHHWTAKGAYEGYAAFCKKAGFTAVPLKDMEKAYVDDFYGTFTSITENTDITENPDYIEYYLQPETKDVTAFTDLDMATSYDTDLFVTWNLGDVQNKYLVFLGGDHPLTRIVTNRDTDRTLVVIKDSFGNALTPFLVNHYKTIYVIDPRTAHGDIRDFCKEHNVDDLLIESYTFSLSTDGARQLLDTMMP